MQAVLRSVDRDCAAGDDQLVVDVKAVLAARRDAQAAAAVDRKIVMAENHAAAFVGDGRLGILRAACETVFRARRQSQKDLVGLIDADAGVVGAADLHPVQLDPDLGRAVRADNDAAIRERAGEHIAARLRNDHVAVVGVGPAAVDHGGVALEDDPRRAGVIPVPVPVVARKPGGVGAVLGIPVDDRGEAVTLPVHEKHGDQDGADEDGNAKEVDVLMR